MKPASQIVEWKKFMEFIRKRIKVSENEEIMLKYILGKLYHNFV